MKRLTVAELARVVEIDCSQEGVDNDRPPRRMFNATKADGTVCQVITGGVFIGDEVVAYCADHGVCNKCEGAVRVLCVLTDERLQALKDTVLGYAVPGLVA